MIRKTLLSKSEVLKEWKFSKKNFPKVTGFRGVQEQAIDSLLEGEKVLCLMPTGGGKTLIFQVAGLALEKTTVVISPFTILVGREYDITERGGTGVISSDVAFFCLTVNLMWRLFCVKG